MHSIRAVFLGTIVSLGVSHLAAADVAPTITSQPASISAVAGSTARFSVAASGTAPLSYQWSKNGTAITSATASAYTTPATVIADGGATFTVIVTNAAGNATSTAATLTVTPPVAPAITGQPTNTSVVAGSTARFSVTASGTAPLSYQWSKNGTAITGATSSAYTSPATTIADDGATYAVTVTNAAGNVTSNTATLTVTPPVAPAITTQPANTSVVVGTTARFYVTASGTAPLSYQWSKNGTAITSAIYASYTTPATAITDDGATYAVTVTNAAGNATSSAATLTVTLPVGPTITTQPTNTGATVGSSARFTVVASGTAPLSYQWSKNGTAIPGATSASYTTPSILIADNGATYTVAIKNAVDTVTSAAATLTANYNLRVTPSAAQILKPWDSITYAVDVAGTSEKPTLTWKATAGSVTDGVYTVPSGFDYTGQTITATSVADTTKTVRAQVYISPTGQMDVSSQWQDNANTSYSPRRVVLYQNGNVVTGEASYGTYKFVVEGTISGTALTLRSRYAGGTTFYAYSTLTVAPDANAITGYLAAYGTVNWTRQAGVTVRITPGMPQIKSPGESITFAADVAGSPINKNVTWTATAGSVTDGVYTVPSGYDYTTQIITATSVSDPTQKAEVQVYISPISQLDVSSSWQDNANLTYSPRRVVLYQNGDAITGEASYGPYKFVVKGTINGTVLSLQARYANNDYFYGASTLTVAPDASTITGYLSAYGTVNWTRQEGVIIRITPGAPLIKSPGESITYVADVAGSPANKAVTWSATAGTFTNGVYTVPSGYDYTYQTITATSVADPSKSTDAEVYISPISQLDVSSTWLDNANSSYSPRHVLLYQNGNAITGEASYGPYKFVVEGTISGTTLTLRARYANNDYFYGASTLTVAPDSSAITGYLSAYGSVNWTRQAGVTVRITPGMPQIKNPGESITYVADVAGSPANKAVTWRATVGSVKDGTYTVPAGYDYTYQTITATSVADPTQATDVQVYISPSSQLDVASTWQDNGNPTYSPRRVVLYQNGDAVTGEASYGPYKFVVKGTINGTVLSLQARYANNDYFYGVSTLTVAPDASAITGYLSAYGSVNWTKETIQNPGGSGCANFRDQVKCFKFTWDTFGEKFETNLNGIYGVTGNITTLVDLPTPGSWQVLFRNAAGEWKSETHDFPSGQTAFSISGVDAGNVQVALADISHSKYYRLEPLVLRGSNNTTSVGINFKAQDDPHRFSIKHLSLGQSSQDENGGITIIAGRKAMVRIQLQDGMGWDNPQDMYQFPKTYQERKVRISINDGAKTIQEAFYYMKPSPVESCFAIDKNDANNDGDYTDAFHSPIVLEPEDVQPGLSITASLYGADNSTIIESKRITPDVRVGSEIFLHPFSVKFANPAFPLALSDGAPLALNPGEFYDKAAKYAEDLFPASRINVREGRTVVFMDPNCYPDPTRGDWENLGNDLFPNWVWVPDMKPVGTLTLSDVTLPTVALFMKFLAANDGYSLGAQNHEYIGLINNAFRFKGDIDGDTIIYSPGVAIFDENKFEGQLGYTVGHEMAHCYGLSHPRGKGTNGDIDFPDKDYPYSNSLLSGYGYSALHNYLVDEQPICTNGVWKQDCMAYIYRTYYKTRFSDYCYRMLVNRVGVDLPSVEIPTLEGATTGLRAKRSVDDSAPVQSENASTPELNMEKDKNGSLIFGEQQARIVEDWYRAHPELVEKFRKRKEAGMMMAQKAPLGKQPEQPSGETGADKPRQAKEKRKPEEVPYMIVTRMPLLD